LVRFGFGGESWSKLVRFQVASIANFLRTSFRFISVPVVEPVKQIQISYERINFMNSNVISINNGSAVNAQQGQIQSGKILYSTGQNDECFTPSYGVVPLLEFVPKDKVIWCPFDTETSEFVKVFTQAGLRVVNSHLSLGQDFMRYEPAEWDILISNPPFTNKRQTFERALSFGKPFALLMSLVWLNDAAPKELFFERELQLLMFDKRIQFENQMQKGVTFSSAYYCWNLLPQQIIMRKLVVPKKKSTPPVSRFVFHKQSNVFAVDQCGSKSQSDGSAAGVEARNNEGSDSPQSNSLGSALVTRQNTPTGKSIAEENAAKVAFF